MEAAVAMREEGESANGLGLSSRELSGLLAPVDRVQLWAQLPLAGWLAFTLSPKAPTSEQHPPAARP